MGCMKTAMIEAYEAGAVPVEMEQVKAWRAEGNVVPLIWVPVTNWQGKTIRLPAISQETATFLASRLDDEQAREELAAAVADLVAYRRTVLEGEIVRSLRRAAASNRATAARIAGEIVAAVAAGEEMPESWHRYDAYADMGEPEAEEVVRLVREELAGTGIRL